MGSSPTTSLQASNRKFQKQGPHRSKNFRIQQLYLDQSDHAVIDEIIKTHCLLFLLTDKQRTECVQHFTKWVYSFGRYIYRQHDLPQDIFLISKGSVSVQIDCSIVKSLGERQYFGHDTACFDAPRSQSIRVITPQITVFAIKKEQIMQFIQERMQAYKEDINTMFNRIHFFNYLTNKQRKFLINSTQLLRLNPNQVLFEKQQDANSFYVVKKNTILIQIDSKKDIVMREGDYFGESAFLQLLNTSKKSQRMGRAVADKDGVEVYAIGLSPVKVCLGYYIRSIIFFNQQKWALFRSEFLNSLLNVDYNYLLQLFNVKEGRKYSVLATKGTRPKYIFIPLQVEINKSKQLRIYGSQLIGNPQSTLTYDIVLTDNGYYAYALIQEIRQVLYLNKNSSLTSQIAIKMLKEPLYVNLTLTLRNLSKFSKRLQSSDYSIVLIVQDMKFGNEFIVKIYKKRVKTLSNSNNCIPETKQDNRSLKSYKVIRPKQAPKNTASSKTSLQTIFSPNIESIQNGKIILQEGQIRRQKDIVNSLISNYVCGYYKSQQDQNNYYIFLQYIIGAKLEDIIGTFGKLPYKLTKYFLASLADALTYLHSQRVVYRNLNPNDTIVKSNGKLVLIDFSCAKRLETHRTSTLIGTPFYMAPEVIKQEKEYSYSVDIWSLGVIFYEMLTGILPFGSGDSDPISIYNAILNNQLNLKIIQSKNQRQLLTHLLDKDPQTRIQNALDIRNFSYIDDLEFQWQKFFKGTLTPPYYPPLTRVNFTNINNYQIFDASSVSDWQ